MLNFRMWFKYGLKAQKLQKQHALKVQLHKKLGNHKVQSSKFNVQSNIG